MIEKRAPLGGSRAPLVVTGFGVLSAAGFGVEPLIHAIDNGDSYIGPLRNIDASDLPNRRGAHIGDEPPTGVSRFAHYLALALRGALDDAESGGDARPIPRARTGVALGTTLGLVDDIAEPAPMTLDEAREQLAVDRCAQRVADEAGLGGSTTAFSLACASGLCASEHASAELALERADAMLVGGADTLGRFMQGGFCSLRGFTSESVDAHNVTIALGEAAAFATLEPIGSARARGARGYGVLESQRLVSDGYHLASPDPSGDGMTRAITLAIDDAGLRPSDIGAVVVTAIGSPFHERMLRDVITRALGDHAKTVPVTSHELAVGHVLAASGIIVLAYAMKLLQNRRVERAISSEALGDGFARATPQSLPLVATHVLTVSVGFGGFNGVSIVGRSV